MSPRWGYYDVAPMGLLRCRPDGAIAIHFSFLIQHYDIIFSSYRNKHISSRTDS